MRWGARSRTRSCAEAYASSRRSKAAASGRRGSPRKPGSSCCPISAPWCARPTSCSRSSRRRGGAAVAAEVLRADGSRRLFAELNAIAPATVRAIADTGLELVDGSISGPPPWRAGTTRVYLSGPRAPEIAALPFEGVDLIVVGPEVGSASAVKMSTASVYKGSSAVLAHALLAAHANGVLEHVLADFRAAAPELIAHVEHRLAMATTKAHRYVGEMREIAATQEAAGLTPALFDAFAEIYTRLAEAPLALATPEDVTEDAKLTDVLDGMRAP